MVRMAESVVQRFTLHLTYHMRRIEIAAVGDGCTEIGYLKRRQRHLALSDGNGDDGQSVPRAMIVAVIVFRIRYHTTLLAGKVDAELIAESHRHHIVTPHVHGVLHGVILGTTAYHIVESPTEVCVAGCGYGLHKGYWRRMGVASYVKSAAIESAVAGKCRRRRNYSFGYISERLGGLERRSRRIHTHDGAVEQRLPCVA